MSKRRLLFTIGVLGLLLLTGCELFQQPPEASFVVVYNVDPVDLMVVDLDARGSSGPAGRAITSYMWDFGEDVTILTPLAETKTVAVPVLRVKYPLEGTYRVELVVTSEPGTMSAPVLGTVTLPHE
ncbi:MAG: PKD domain-containing protein [Candidatus Bipolaricaulis sp.]|nr:PKD domain-containing protein [Candidatus Bipolaricaulis sp.]